MYDADQNDALANWDRMWWQESSHLLDKCVIEFVGWIVICNPKPNHIGAIDHMHMNFDMDENEP
jgi:hypothetical protein